MCRHSQHLKKQLQQLLENFSQYPTSERQDIISLLEEYIILFRSVDFATSSSPAKRQQLLSGKLSSAGANASSTRRHRIACTECDYHAATARDIMRHARTHDAHTGCCVEVSCLFCEGVFANNTLLCLHECCNPHTDDVFIPRRCALCSQRFVTLPMYAVHRQLHHKGVAFFPLSLRTTLWLFRCGACCRRFLSRTQLATHSLSHHGVRFRCHLCSATFGGCSALRTHQRSAHRALPAVASAATAALPTSASSAAPAACVGSVGNSRHPCGLCSRTYARRNALKRHMRSHCGDFVWCHVCSYKTADRGNMLQHRKTHAAVKEHQCELCGCSFATKRTLVEHRQFKHSAARAFKCVTCGENFKTRGTLRRHALRHAAAPRRHTCASCGAGFLRHAHLTRHAAACCGGGGGGADRRRPQAREARTGGAARAAKPAPAEVRLGDIWRPQESTRSVGAEVAGTTGATPLAGLTGPTGNQASAGNAEVSTYPSYPACHWGVSQTAMTDVFQDTAAAGAYVGADVFASGGGVCHSEQWTGFKLDAGPATAAFQTVQGASSTHHVMLPLQTTYDCLSIPQQQQRYGVPAGPAGPAGYTPAVMRPIPPSSHRSRQPLLANGAGAAHYSPHHEAYAPQQLQQSGGSEAAAPAYVQQLPSLQATAPDAVQSLQSLQAVYPRAAADVQQSMQLQQQQLPPMYKFNDSHGGGYQYGVTSTSCTDFSVHGLINN